MICTRVFLKRRVSTLEKNVRIPSQKRSIEKKEKIIETGFQIFLERGYFDVTTADIAKEANLATGTVYSYFKDKKDILLECLDKFGNELMLQLLKNIEGISASNDSLDIAKKVLQAFIKFHTGQRVYHYDVMSLQYTDEDVRNFFKQVERTMMSAIVEQLGKAGFVFRNEREQTFLIFSMIRSLEEQLVFQSDDKINTEVLTDECARIIASMVTKNE